MIFEDILEDIGGYGVYQKTLVVVFLIPCSIVIPWFSMNTIFHASIPEHWCYVPEVANSNLSMDARRKLISPPIDQSCSMYDIDYSAILSTENFTVDSNWPIKQCNTGWEYDKTNYEATAVTEWNMVCNDDHYSSLFISVSCVGVLIGTPISGILSDRMGRKPIFLLTAFIIAVTDIGSVICPNFWVFLCLRILNGTCLTAIYTLVFILLLELVNPANRTRISGISTTAWTFGMCILPAVAWATHNWLYLSMFTTLSSAALLLYWKIIPESPSWLIGQGKYQEAYEILEKIGTINKKNSHKPSHIMEKIQKLGDEIRIEQKSKNNSSPKYYFVNPKLRKRFILVAICWVCGNMPYVGHQINYRNLAGNEFLNFFYISAVEFPTSIVTWIMMENIGRRWSAVTGFLLSVLACLIPIIVPPEYGTAGVIAALLAKAGSSASYQTIYQVAPELFPTSIRAIGMGMCSMIAVGSTFVAPYIVYLAKFGFHVPFVCFAIISIVGGISALFLPETLNKKLPQVVADVENSSQNQKFWSCGGETDPDLEMDDILKLRRNSQLYTIPRSSLINNIEMINYLRRDSVNTICNSPVQEIKHQ